MSAPSCREWIGRRILGEHPPFGSSSPKREALTARLDSPQPPQLDSQTVTAYRRQTEKLMAPGQSAERKRFMRAWVQEIKLEPQTLEVKISYRLPEVVMKGVVAGAGFEPATFGL
jgi:hypothetical protein